MKKILLVIPAFFLAAAGTISGQTTIFSEDFQGTTGTAIPGTWSQSTLASDGGWKTGTALGSTSFAIPAHTRYIATNDDACNCNKSNDFLKTPAFSLAGTVAPQATFDILYDNGLYGGFQEIGTIEVSTNSGVTWTVVETLGSIPAWTNHATNLSAYAGMTNVMLGFRYNDATGYEFGMALDNVMVIEPSAKEGAVTAITMSKYVLAGNQSVIATFKSTGGPTVASAILNYSVNGGAPVAQTFSPAIGYGASYTAAFTTLANLTAGLKTIKAWVSDINGTGPDANPTNDTATVYVTVQATKPAKKVLVEEFTGAWCGYCPRGGVTLSDITTTDPNIIGAAIHGGGTDNMATPEGTTVINNYASGFPTGMVDRSYVAAATDYAIDDADWISVAASRENEVVPATVALSAITFNTSTRLVSVTVTATFFGDVKGAFGLNCYLTENNVYGPLGVTTDNGWNQHSYYYGSAGSPFQGVGLTTSPWSTGVAGLMPADYVHNHVVDKMIGGAYGDNTVIPTTLVTSGTTFSKTFTYTLPAANPGGAHRFNPDNIYVIGLIQEYAAGTKANSYLLNVTEQKLNTNAEQVLSVNDIQTTEFGSVAVYPNPASTTANISVDLTDNASLVISVYNAVGQKVYAEDHTNLSSGNHLFNFNTDNLSNGIYNIVVSTEKGSITKKIVINK